MSKTKSQDTDDLQAPANLKRIDDLETFRKDFEGKEFDKKILASVKDSHPIREELRKIVWETVKNKIVWIILGVIGLLLINVALKVVPTIILNSFSP